MMVAYDVVIACTMAMEILFYNGWLVVGCWMHACGILIKGR